MIRRAAVLLALAAVPTFSQAQPLPAPTIETKAELHGAVLVRLAAPTAGVKIYYTLDGSTPTTASQQYLAPFLIDEPATLKAAAIAASGEVGAVASQALTIDVAPGALVWADDFKTAGAAPRQPNPAVWTYDAGHGGFGNQEMETYCGWESPAPCDAAHPSAYVGADGYLHIVTRQPSPGVYTSARLKTEGRFSFRYGRLEARVKVPEAQGFWPAVWLLGNTVATINWPGCGEMDIQERVNTPTTPDWNAGSIHGPGFVGEKIGVQYKFPPGQNAGGWHTYGVIWTPGRVSYYIDDPTKPYATYTPADLAALPGAHWPFDEGQSQFIIINLAIGGSWPKAPDATTPFPSEMLVDYVRLYKQ